MLSLPNTEIAIWGAGNVGKKYFFKLREHYNIVCFYDNDPNKVGQEVIENVKAEKYNGQGYYIVIASGYWKEISIQLQKNNLKLGKDFMPANLLFTEKLYITDLIDTFKADDVIQYLRTIKKEKKLAMVYGNCQAEVICNMLEFNKQFNDDYAILRIPAVHLYKDLVQVKQVFYGSIIKLIDLFIYQNVSQENGYYPELASAEILKQLNPCCNTIRIHNIYFDGYFLQFDNTIRNRMIFNNEKYLFPYGDRYIHKLIEDNYKTKDIVDIISHEDFTREDEVLEKCEKSIDELKRREKTVDVSIADYINQQYKNCQLFYTRNHPCNHVLNVYTDRLLDTLGYEADGCQRDESILFMMVGYGMKICDWPIYPSVINALGLKKHEEYFYIYTLIDSQLYTFREYMKEYISRCYSKFD